jgi:hypothetical protein
MKALLGRLKGIAGTAELPSQLILAIRVTPGWAVRCLQAAKSLTPAFLGPRSVSTVAMVLAACVHTTADVPLDQFKPLDLRAVKLERFFQLYRCPAPHHVVEYLKAADTYGLDYRLLPALSIRETTCGAYQWENNRWGYHPGQQTFASVAEGIDYVARVLAENPFYKGKSLREKLFTYNPLPTYPREVEWIMRQIE